MKTIRALTRLLAPVPGEAFTSYVDRLAAFHKVNLLVMLQYVGIKEAERYEPMFEYGISLYKSALERFSTATRRPPFVIAKMLLCSYDGIAVNLPCRARSAAPNTLLEWATSEWTYFSSSHACPHCIRDDQGAWKLAWKLPWSFACIKHKCYLVPRCPACERRLASGHRDKSLSPWFVREVPKPGHCSNPQPDGMGRLGPSSLPCDHDLGSIPTTAASPETLCVQELLDACLSGRVPTILGSQVSAPDYFCDLRSLCALILYCAEPDDLGRLAPPEDVAFRAFADERDRILVDWHESPNPRKGEWMRAHQESPDLMAAIIPLATTILAAADTPSIMALLLPLTERLLTRTRQQRYGAAEHFRFSDRLAPVIGENVALRDTFDRAIRRKAAASRKTPFGFEPRHVPQLLWQDHFDRSFEVFFPSVPEFLARRFCAVALVKLCGDYTWVQSAAKLDLSAEEANRMAYWCISILEETGGIAAFGKSLRKVATHLSNNPDKVDYGIRRDLLSTLTHIPPVPWSDICRLAKIAPDIGRRDKRAAVWLWVDLTDGDWRMSPAIKAENNQRVRDPYHALSRTLIPKMAPHLRAYGAQLLENIDRFSESR
jgi:hypothetical protein